MQITRISFPVIFVQNTQEPILHSLITQSVFRREDYISRLNLSEHRTCSSEVTQLEQFLREKRTTIFYKIYLEISHRNLINK